MSKPKPRYNNKFLKYSQLGFVIMGAILLGAFVGWKIDKYLQTEQPYATAAFSLLGVCAGIYLALKDFIIPKK